MKISRISSLLHNLHVGGHSWRENEIAKERVFHLNRRIGEGSEKLWSVLEEKLEQAVDSGLLK